MKRWMGQVLNPMTASIGYGRHLIIKYMMSLASLLLRNVIETMVMIQIKGVGHNRCSHNHIWDIQEYIAPKEKVDFCEKSCGYSFWLEAGPSVIPSEFRPRFVTSQTQDCKPLLKSFVVMTECTAILESVHTSTKGSIRTPRRRTTFSQHPHDS